MTEKEFISLNPGDRIHYPGRPNEIWTIIGKQNISDKYLAVLGKVNIAHPMNLWDRLLAMPEERCIAFAKRCGLTVTSVINPASWDKQSSDQVKPV